MLNEKDALDIQIVSYGTNIRNNKLRTQKVYVYKCSCGAEIRSQKQHLKKHSGKCVSCSQFNDPFRAAFNELSRGCERKNREISLTYEDFLEFTKIDKCHYCHSLLEWRPHTNLNGKEVPGSRSYKLDRMDNNKGYLKDNCVACCRKCNEAKGARYTYEEWYAMTAYFRK